MTTDLDMVKACMKDDIFSELRTNEFYSAIEEYCKYRRSIKKRLEPAEAERLLYTCLSLGAEEAIEQIKDKTISLENAQAPSVSEEELYIELICEQIWEVYPRKVQKKNGLKAIEKALGKLEKDDKDWQWLKNKVEAYAESVKDRDKTFILHCSTYMNGERWNDELEAPISNKPQEFEED